MNKKRRNDLGVAASYMSNAISSLRLAQGIVDRVKDKEQDCLDNTPENLQYSYMYERREEIVDSLDNAISSLSESIDYIDSAIS